MECLRIGHQYLVGKTTLNLVTIIDIIELYDRISFDVADEEGNIKNDFDVENEDIFALYRNGIDQAETQDTKGSFSVEGDELQTHSEPWSVGQKIEFECEVKGATLKVKGFIVRNFWTSYYKVTEMGVSVPSRYWKVPHSKCTKII